MTRVRNGDKRADAGLSFWLRLMSSIEPFRREYLDALRYRPVGPDDHRCDGGSMRI